MPLSCCPRLVQTRRPTGHRHPNWRPRWPVLKKLPSVFDQGAEQDEPAGPLAALLRVEARSGPPDPPIQVAPLSLRRLAQLLAFLLEKPAYGTLPRLALAWACTEAGPDPSRASAQPNPQASWTRSSADDAILTPDNLKPEWPAADVVIRQGSHRTGRSGVVFSSVRNRVESSSTSEP